LEPLGPLACLVGAGIGQGKNQEGSRFLEEEDTDWEAFGLVEGHNLVDRIVLADIALGEEHIVLGEVLEGTFLEEEGTFREGELRMG
jgi:hypothetical protein